MKSRGFIDFHCHLLPGLDDGAADLEESLAIARVLADLGFTEVYCTPHGSVGNSAYGLFVRSRVASLRRSLHEAHIPLAVQPGIEYALQELDGEAATDLLPLGRSGLLLVEAPFQGDLPQPLATIEQLVQRGQRPLIAHPERCRIFTAGLRDEEGGFADWMQTLLGGRRREAMGIALLAALRDLGCCIQGNIGSFAGVYGEQVGRDAERLLAMGLYTHLGSDAHSLSGLDVYLRKGMRRIEELAGREATVLLLSGSPGGTSPARRTGTAGTGP